MLTGIRGDAEGLLSLDPAPYGNDPHTLFTFHFYYPTLFVFQSHGSLPDLRTAADIAYPSRLTSPTDSLNALGRRLALWHVSPKERDADYRIAALNLAQYRTLNFDRSTIGDIFGRIAIWAGFHGIAADRIVLGEFNVVRRYGSYEGARDADRFRWLRDVHDAAEDSGFGWCIWAYSGEGGMAIVKTDSSDEIEPLTLEALRLP